MGKGSGKGPVFRAKLKRKDGKEGVGTNRDGSTYKAVHIEFMTIWPSDNGFGMNGTLAPGFALTYQGKPVADSYINIFGAGPKGGTKRASDDEGDDEDDGF